MSDERTPRNHDEEPGATHRERPAAAPAVPGFERQLGDDPVDWDSDGSFPASDPPPFSGAAAVRDGLEEEPPNGPQASWSVEHEAGAGEPPSGADDQDAGVPADPARRGGRPRSA